MVLDTLVRVLEVECCWVQTSDAGKKTLHLAAERGLSPEMRREITALDTVDGVAAQVVGAGSRVVVPDLSRDGRYGLASFRASGYRWLVVVPLMTYRVHGLLGVASRYKNRLRRDTADLVMVIAGLIGTALNRAGLSRRAAVPEKPEQPHAKEDRPAPAAPRQQAKPPTSHEPKEEKPVKPPEGAFPKHVHRMKDFRRHHR
jgi:signal transduction protein with GAF and PtsI domain